MTKRAKQRDSDRLAFVQVDRAVIPKAALLAGAVGATPQHMVGSLVEFWTLNGDPREIERLLNEGKREVVISAETVIARFELASGKVVQPSLLVGLGLLEPRGELFRVRGMSRLFAPIERRLAKRRAAVAGGKARASAQRNADGQFTGAGGPAGALAGGVAGGMGGERVGGGWSPAQPDAQPESSQSPATSQPEGQPLATTEDRGHRSEAKSIVEQARPAGAQEVFDCWQAAMGKPRAKFIGKRLKAVRRALADGYSVDDLKAAVLGASKTAHVNDKGVRFNDLELICRDATYIERFMGAAEHGIGNSSRPGSRLVGADLTAIHAREREERETRADPLPPATRPYEPSASDGEDWS